MQKKEEASALDSTGQLSFLLPPGSTAELSTHKHLLIKIKLFIFVFYDWHSLTAQPIDWYNQCDSIIAAFIFGQINEYD